MDTPSQSTDDKCLTWRLPVSEDGVIELPDDLVEATGWKAGTPIYWYPQDDGTIIVSSDHREPQGDFIGFSKVETISNGTDKSNDAEQVSVYG